MTVSSSSKRGKATVPYYPPLAISIHGIRTRGVWQKTFATVISGTSTKVESHDYGSYSLMRFVTPTMNARMIDKFYDWYGSTLRSYPAINLALYDQRPSVVAHSLGSWILGNAMLKFDDICFDKIILAGTILPVDFDWCSLFARDQVASVLNECGEVDPWPKLVGHFVANTGDGGTKGFEWFSSAVENVYSSRFGHSEALMRSHIVNKWVPFLSRTPSPLAVLHGRNINNGDEFSATLDHTGTIIDDKAFGKLPNYRDVEIPRGLSLTWIGINPDIYTFLIDRNSRTPAGYLNAMPIEDSLYDRIRNGEVTDNQIFAKDIVPYNGPTKSLKIYLMSIAIDGQYRRWGDGILQQAYVQMITGFLDKLTYYAKHHGVRATHFIATAWTEEGRRMCESLRMKQVGLDRYNDSIFELKLESLKNDRRVRCMPALRHLLQVYAHYEDK